VRTEIIGSRGSVFIGTVQGAPATFLSAAGASAVLADHFLSRFADAYLLEARAFINTVLNGKAPQINGEDGLRALQIAVAAEKSHRSGQPCKVTRQAAD
jgi:scyllo-inositol 2-dehydrogenase (NAD+)